MSFLPVINNFEVFSGASFFYSFEWLKKEGTNKPVDLKNFAAIMPIVPISSRTIWKTLESESSPTTGILLGGESGIIGIFIADEITREIPWKRATYELLLTNTLEEKTYPILKGQLEIVTGIPQGVLKEV